MRDLARDRIIQLFRAIGQPPVDMVQATMCRMLNLDHDDCLYALHVLVAEGALVRSKYFGVWKASPTFPWDGPIEPAIAALFTRRERITEQAKKIKRREERLAARKELEQRNAARAEARLKKEQEFKRAMAEYQARKEAAIAARKAVNAEKYARQKAKHAAEVLKRKELEQRVKEAEAVVKTPAAGVRVPASSRDPWAVIRERQYAKPKLLSTGIRPLTPHELMTGKTSKR